MAEDSSIQSTKEKETGVGEETAVNGGEMGEEVDRKNRIDWIGRKKKIRKIGAENDNKKKGSSLTEHLALELWNSLSPTSPHIH